VPYHLILELNQKTDVPSLYLPQNPSEPPADADPEFLMKTIEELASLNPDLWIQLGAVYEPLLHPSFKKILKWINQRSLRCVIETSGRSITAEWLEELSGCSRDLIHFVLKFDCYDEARYPLIHPGESFDPVRKAFEILKESGFRVYKQVVRMVENEPDIEKYIRSKETDNLIIRKYSTFTGELPDRKVVDLSPLTRIPCHQLRRAITILPDRKVPYCLYARKRILGDLLTEPLSAVLMRMEDAYQKNARKEYTDFCRNCDDYYIFNF
jgi:spiro-SPASM protein